MSSQRLPAILLTSLLLSCGTATATAASPASRTATASKTATTSSGKGQKQSGSKAQKAGTQKASTQAAGKAQKAPAGKAQKGQTGTAKSSKGQKKRTSAGKAAKRETSATVKRQQQSVNNEIARTQQQIEANDVAVSTNLATLQTLQQEVAAQQTKVTNLRNREQSLQATIAQCSQKIAASEARLAKMRAQYVAAIKKMRAARKRNNTLAFIFSSKNFYQALRRLRYLHTFSDWRARKEQEIKAEVEQLAKQQQTLAAGQAALRTTLSEQETAHRVLTEKQRQQSETVSKLRADGTALRSHLQRKQAEANALNSRVADLIAREQAEAAAAEQRRREEAERRAEAQRRAETERAEARRLAAEKAAAEKAAAKKAAAERAQATPPQQPKQQPAKPQPKPQPKAQPQKSQPKPEPQTKQSGKEEPRYADARRRRPRNEKPATPPAKAPETKAPETKAPAKAPAPTKAPAPAKSTASAGGFASAKGSLPRPVAGSFSIVSKFGRHPLPDLPEVMYDNPGIDAVVSKGASAQAVYAGTVTGVYALPGYSTVVIISHGDYYTVYGNIGTPAVRKGDTVKAGQALGKLVSDASERGRTTIHFEVWKNREKQNPEAWIR